MFASSARAARPRRLAEARVQVVGIEAITGFPEMMDGRVKTLHPKIHAALLGLRDKAEHLEAMKIIQHRPDRPGLREPLSLRADRCPARLHASRRPSRTSTSAAPAMIRSAAKNHRYVTVVTSPDQYDRVMEQMQASGGLVGEQLRTDLARAAFGLTAAYDAAIARYLNIKAGVDFPERVTIPLTA